jgi:hypothetical protein
MHLFLTSIRLTRAFVRIMDLSGRPSYKCVTSLCRLKEIGAMSKCDFIFGWLLGFVLMLPSGHRMNSFCTGMTESCMLSRIPNWSRMRAAPGKIVKAAPCNDTISLCFSRTTCSILASCKAWDNESPATPAPTIMTLKGFREDTAVGSMAQIQDIRSPRRETGLNIGLNVM